MASVAVLMGSEKQHCVTEKQLLHLPKEIENVVLQELCFLFNIRIWCRCVIEANVKVGHAIHQHESAKEEDSPGPILVWLGNEDMIDSFCDEDGTQVIQYPLALLPSILHDLLFVKVMLEVVVGKMLITDDVGDTHGIGKGPD